MTDPTEESSSYNTPVDDPHHYDFKNADVPLSPDENTPPTHRQHKGGYEMNEGVDILGVVAPKKDD
jgi:hypothetical protein